MINLVKYLQEKLDALTPNFYIVSKERNINADYNKAIVVVSALSGNVYRDSGNIPYEIEIITNEIDKVMGDFVTLGKQNNTKPYTQILVQGESDYQSSTLIPFFNTPVVVDKNLELGSDKYARIVVFATINEQENVSNIKHLTIDNEEIEILNGSLVYVTESDPARVSGQELTRSKKKVSSYSITFSVISKSSVFLNKAFRIATGQLAGNTSFSVKVVMENGLEATNLMFIGSYTLSNERSKLPSINIGLHLFDNRGNNNA